MKIFARWFKTPKNIEPLLTSPSGPEEQIAALPNASVTSEHRIRRVSSARESEAPNAEPARSRQSIFLLFVERPPNGGTVYEHLLRMVQILAMNQGKAFPFERLSKSLRNEHYVRVPTRPTAAEAIAAATVVRGKQLGFEVDLGSLQHALYTASDGGIGTAVWFETR